VSTSEPSPIIQELLAHLDADPKREGLQDTPQRYAAFVKEFFDVRPLDLTVFKNEGYDEMIVQSNIAFYSICEHHLLPFFGYGSIAYVPDKHIVGLSKLSRTLEHFAHRLQNQERITTQVAEFLADKLHPKGVGVILSARHLCMEMRGTEKPGTQTTTSCLKGSFKANSSTRSEFLQIVQNNLIQ
jgi:GTP cyclohydrolase I